MAHPQSGAVTRVTPVRSRASFLQVPAVPTIATSTAAEPADGLLHHVAATKTATTVKIYVDGVEGTTPVSPIQVVQNTTFPLLFGSGGTQPATIDEFAIYDQVLTAAEIGAHAAGIT